MSAPSSAESSKTKVKPKSEERLTLDNSLKEAVPRPGGFLKVLPEQKPADSGEGPDGSRKGKNHICNCKPRVSDDIKSSSAEIKKPSKKDMDVATSSHDSTTREFRIAKALEDSEWDAATIDEDAGSESGVKFQENKVSINLLSVLISTIMMLAAGKDVPKESIDAAIAYLPCVTDDGDAFPPNIQGLLNYIELKTGEKPKKVNRACPRKVTILSAKKGNKKSLDESE